jgi:hypothetical protein
MNEQEWLCCDDANVMLELIKGECSWTEEGEIWSGVENARNKRRFRLLACACCRLVWNLLDVSGRQSVERAEAFADGLCTEKQLRVANRKAGQASRKWMQEAMGANDETLFRKFSVSMMAGRASDEFPLLGAIETLNELRKVDASKGATAASLCRDLFNNPFHPAVLDSKWLSPDVVEMARSIYAERSFDRLPEIANGLEKGGCTDKAVLDHCRVPGEHVRGCWVLDTILEKQWASDRRAGDLGSR